MEKVVLGLIIPSFEYNPDCRLSIREGIGSPISRIDYSFIVLLPNNEILTEGVLVLFR